MTDERDGLPQTISHYELTARLGGGAMGTVYKATDRRDGSAAAVKLMNAALSADPEFRERFEREAHVAALLRSPYVARVLDYGEEGGRYFIAMEYVAGRSLREAIDLGPLPVERALRVAAQVARALEEAEARGVIHRDIKPDNVLLSDGDSVKVADFGIARQAGAGGMTVPGSIVGTLAYAAPEIGRGESDHRSDIYSLGATLYHALVGRPPFEGEALEMLRQHAESPLPMEPLSGLSGGVARIIERCMAKDPAQRYQRASELAGALEQALTAVRTGAADDSTVVKPRGEYEPTRVATPLAPTVAAGGATAAAGASPIALVLGPQRSSRLGAAKYSLSVRNNGSAPLDVALSASSQEGGCDCSVPGRMTIGPGQTVRTELKARPRSRKWFGGKETSSFTVSASGGGGVPPATAIGQFDNVPFGFLPIGALLGVGAAAAVAAVLLLGGGGDSKDTSDGGIVANGSPGASSDATPEPVAGSSSVYAEYILDASGSMEELLEGKTRMEIARAVLTERLAALPSDINVGLRVYGHRIPFDQEGACDDTELAIPIQQGGVAPIQDYLPGIVPVGMTPISESLRQVADDFNLEPGRKNVVVLISDGEETCGGEPAEAVRFLQEVGIDFTIHVIGLDVDETARQQLKAIADTAGGVYHDANSEEDLRDALTDIDTRVAEPPAGGGTPAATEQPQLVDATSEGAPEASSTYEGYPADLAVDGDVTTSWFSTGPGSQGAPTFYTWSAPQDELIEEVTIIGNAANATPDFRTGFGFESAIVTVLDANGQAVYEEDVSLAGTPDPDVTVRPGVVGRSVRLVLSGHEAPDCGGFAELVVLVAR